MGEVPQQPQNSVNYCDYGAPGKLSRASITLCNSKKMDSGIHM